MECQDCKQEVSEADSCTKKTIEGVPRNSEYFDNGERCHDCNIVNKKGNFHHLGCDVERCHDCNIVNKKGNFHHLGCDVERCPKCGNQLISCGCFVF